MHGFRSVNRSRTISFPASLQRFVVSRGKLSLLKKNIAVLRSVAKKSDFLPWKLTKYLKEFTI